MSDYGVGNRTCYCVVHQKLKDGALVTIHAGLYSECAFSLTGYGDELRSDVFSVKGQDFQTALDNANGMIDHFAELGMPGWDALKNLVAR